MNVENEQKGEQKNTAEPTEQKKIEVVVKRRQQIYEIVRDSRTMWRMLLVMFFLTAIIVAGLTIMVITIKSHVPYSLIETNIEGATTLKSEDKDVTYWLFNTAELWANSGIEVEEGDELTIIASGAFNTAVHHLVDNVRDNHILRDKWIGTEGTEEKSKAKDKLRARYRIISEERPEILLMQVARSKADVVCSHYEKGGNIEVIGRERRNLKVTRKGTLFFAVNDIVLTDSVIKDMYIAWMSTVRDSLCNKYQYAKDVITRKFNEAISCMENRNGISSWDSVKQLYLSAYEPLKDYCANHVSEMENWGLGFGRYPKTDDDKENSLYNAYPIVNELLYYGKEGFRDAWFVDNIGSFLIVVERKKK